MRSGDAAVGRVPVWNLLSTTKLWYDYELILVPCGIYRMWRGPVRNVLFAFPRCHFRERMPGLKPTPEDARTEHHYYTLPLACTLACQGCATEHLGSLRRLLTGGMYRCDVKCQDRTCPAYEVAPAFDY